ncbi:unnamed protein product [Leptidea sinapis]|uniref:Uncharacterized protein n=1 Tax=Leptidea sinapis TaxID=189913 RepID=A0A5E4R4S1_9NEOP|nr:unnamed protein product [Leptidea sinapis]
MRIVNKIIIQISDVLHKLIFTLLKVNKIQRVPRNIALHCSIGKVGRINGIKTMDSHRACSRCTCYRTQSLCMDENPTT